MQLNELIEANHFEEREEVCPGCANKCQVHCYTFANGKTYFSGIMFYMQFDTLVKREQHAGRLAKVEPFDIMMSIASMTVFTFLALPLYQDLLSRTDEQVLEFIAHRKQEITRLVLNGLRP